MRGPAGISASKAYLPLCGRTSFPDQYLSIKKSGLIFSFFENLPTLPPHNTLFTSKQRCITKQNINVLNGDHFENGAYFLCCGLTVG